MDSFDRRHWVRAWLEDRGWIIRRKQRGYDLFRECAQSLEDATYRQTPEDAQAYANRFLEPVFGTLPMMDLLERLAEVTDPSDQSLGSTNQLEHVLQVVYEMEEDGIEDRDFLVMGLVHDLGKLLLLTDHPIHSLLGVPKPVGPKQRRAGLDSCTFRWTVDEYAYFRLRDHLPEPMAWLLRYHTIDIDGSTDLMDDRDLEYRERYLRPFYRYDQGSKSPYYRSPRRLEDYRDLIESYFPEPIAF